MSEFNPCPGQRRDSACHIPDNAGTAPAIPRTTQGQRLPYPRQRGHSACHIPDNTGQRLPYRGQWGDSTCHILGNAGTAPAIFQTTRGQHLLYPGQRGDSTCHIPKNAGTAPAISRTPGYSTCNIPEKTGPAPAISQTTRGQHLQHQTALCPISLNAVPDSFPTQCPFFLAVILSIVLIFLSLFEVISLAFHKPGRHISLKRFLIF